MATKAKKRVGDARRCLKRGEKRKTTKMDRKVLDRILEARHEAHRMQKLREKKGLVAMDNALTEIWHYIVSPENRISNFDADRILPIIKRGLESRRRKEEE